MPDSAEYPIREVLPEWVLETEQLGSKTKFWYREPGPGPNDETEKPQWLFKYPRPATGEHWAEKVAEEIASFIGIDHAKVDLAIFQNEAGSATETFARGGRALFLGNQILAGQVLGYDPQKKQHQSDHTLENILRALSMVIPPDGLSRAKTQFADYLTLDGLIGNTDRHHENWGILRKRIENGWHVMLAPTFDHASSLGRELQDEKRETLMKENRVGYYAERGHGGIYWQTTDKSGVSPLELVRRACTSYPEIHVGSLARLDKLNRDVLDSIIRSVPSSWMSELSRRFAVELMCYNLDQLRKIKR